MRVLIHVCAMDEERGVKCTREDTVEVPGKVTRLHEMLGGDENAVLRRVGDTVFAAAMRELQAGRVDLSGELLKAEGGRVGKRMTESAPGEPAKTGGLGAALGLDIIRRQVQKEREHAPAPQPSAPQGPGVAGFPRR